MTQNQISSNDQTGNVAKPLLSERFLYGLSFQPFLMKRILNFSIMIPNFYKSVWLFFLLCFFIIIVVCIVIFLEISYGLKTGLLK
jgi:hypothetical protein